MYDASGTITTGGTAQLVLPEHNYRTSIFFQNISSNPLYLEFGGARATATLTNGVVTGITVTNGGFGYTAHPGVKFFGGGDSTINPTYLAPGLPGQMSSHSGASGLSVLTNGSVSSITILNGGKHYVNPPYVFLQSSEQDPYGCATPSATSGALLLPNGGSLFYNGTALTTDAVAIYGATTGQAYTVKYTIGG
jgi:hypothetical protein